jgi:hypothetical protein
MERSRLALIGAPLAALLIGGGVGWFMRDDSGPAATSGTVVGRDLPAGAELDALAPVRPLASAHNTMVIDQTRIVGMPERTTVHVPAAAALPLSLGSDGTITPVDARSLRPVEATTPPALPPVEPVPVTELPAPAEPVVTSPPPDGAAPTTSAPTADPTFIDPCVLNSGCPGGPALALAEPTTVAKALDPFQMSVPFAASGAIADMCNTIEAGAVPDTFLSPATRPTVAVVTNQPSTIALSGTWSDGQPLDKLTMVTSTDFDDQWQQQWDGQGVQGLLVACITLPLDTVRAHAAAGRALLDATVLGISATGRVELGGGVSLSIPLDGEDPPFVDQLSVTSLGELRQADGTLAPTVHVHYAVVSDNIIPPAGQLNQRTAKVYGSHAFVENADCAGWAVNQQGLDRSGSGEFTVSLEQRTIAGRSRPVTVVDGDLTLDPVQPGGWDGFLCAHLFVADDSGNRVTVALRGAEVRSPRTAVYTVGTQIIDDTFPADWKVEATWSRPDGGVWCGPAELTSASGGATCTTYARSAPDGITLLLRGVDAAGADRPAFVMVVPVNTAYCNPDDPDAWSSDGCSTGFTQRIRVPLDAAGTESVVMALSVVRAVEQGTRLDNPSNTWRIGLTQAFAF